MELDYNSAINLFLPNYLLFVCQELQNEHKQVLYKEHFKKQDTVLEIRRNEFQGRFRFLRNSPINNHIFLPNFLHSPIYACSFQVLGLPISRLSHVIC